MTRAIIVLLLVVLVGVGGYLLGDGGSDDSDDPGAQSLLVVKGLAKLDGNRLEINAPQIEWFSDHPNRDSGRYVAHTVVDNWDSWGFGDDPPNAAFSGIDAVVELTDPTLSSNGTLGFELTPVDGELRSGNLGEQALFIDAQPTYVNSQITDGDPDDGDSHCQTTIETGTAGLALTQADPETGSSRYEPTPLPTTIDPDSSAVIELRFGNSYHADLIYKRGDNGDFVHIHPHCDRGGIVRKDTSCSVIDGRTGYPSPCREEDTDVGSDRSVVYSV